MAMPLLEGLSLERALTNLHEWLREHALPEYFPDLSKAPALVWPQDHEKVFLRGQGGELKDLLRHIMGAQRTLVRFNAGHGVTTLARAAAHFGREARQAVYLFVEPCKRHNLFSDDPTDGGVEEILAGSIIEALLSRNYEDFLHQDAYSVFFDILNVKNVRTLNYYRNRFLGEEAGHVKGADSAEYYKWLAETTQAIKQNLISTIRRLHSDVSLSTILIFDFPHDASHDAVGRVVKAMKLLDETIRAERGYPKMALRVVYFVPHEVADLIKSMWQTSYVERVVHPYNRAEVFFILTQRCNPTQLGRPVALNTILDVSIFDQTYDIDSTLIEILQKMRSTLESYCNLPRDQIGPALRPTLEPPTFGAQHS